MPFLISLLLMAWSSLRWSTRFAKSEADRFWIFVAVVLLQVGGIASVTSLIRQLTPATWLLVQVFGCALTVRCTGSIGRPRLHHLLAGGRRVRSRLATFATGLTPWGAMALLALCGMLATSLVVQAGTPIVGFDEKMYHASRVIYWIQHRTVLPFETHNIRQTMLPFGSELLFLWPVLLSKTELVGRLVFWLAYPAAAVGQYFLLRALRLSQTAGLAGALILLSTPLIAAHSVRLKPEIWAIVTLLGLAYWVISICGRSEASRAGYFLLGIFGVLSINVRPFAIALVPSLLLIALWAPGQLGTVMRIKSLAAGLACAAACSGLLIPLASNTALYGSPLGPQEVRRVVEAEVTPRMVYTHAVRFAFLMLELPDVPASAEARALVGSAGNRLISTVGAGTPLPGEALPWPGRFSYALPEHAARYSLWGWLWIPTLLVAAALLVRNIASTWPRVQLTALSAQTLLAVPLLGAILFGSRWMADSDVPGRFLIGPYALLLPVGMALFVPWISSRTFRQALAAVAVAYCAYQPLRAQAYDAVQAVIAPAPDMVVNEPFDEVVRSVTPAGSRILFVGDQNAPDYPLFSAATHYSNAVIPWGTGAFDPVRMRRLIALEKVTHVLVQNEDNVKFQWLPALDTRRMVAWLAKQDGLKSIPLKAPHMRLFAVGDGSPMNEDALRTTGVPSFAPLITVDPALRTQVGLDPILLETPWPVEDLGGAEGGFLWVGQGHPEGVGFGVWSREDRDVDLRFNVGPGPSLTVPQRKVILHLDGVPVGDEHNFSGPTSLVLRIRLHRGRNLISFFAVDTATVKAQPNGDTRHLVIALHDIQIRAAQAAAAGNDRPQAPAISARDANRGNLADSARKAVGLISEHQQADGFWLTSYTSGERFENVTVEMNTFVTATMVDLLGQHTPSGLSGSLERARAHLRDQIEETGLVRYHGRPDAPAMAAYGLCRPITPDADDTALAWRIAPGAEALRSNALATLARFRTAEGLYETWLAPRDAYRCLDPGADPNPTDVGIQMHVLLFLAQADPPAARALCSALKRTVDQDRIWVYYRRTPLVPMLRQPRVQAAGCDLQLPAARSRTANPEQEIWLEAGRMLQRLDGPAGQFPGSAEIRSLLNLLSMDDFAPVRLNPPLLYHNDQTASVRRFYWAEDVGYAIWLKLYGDSLRLGLLPADASAPAHAGDRIVQKTP